MKQVNSSSYREVKWWRCRRYWLALLLFVGLALFGLMRGNLSIVIVCMVKSSRQGNRSIGIFNITQEEGYSYNLTGNRPDSCTGSALIHPEDEETGEFEWDKPLQGILLGGFYWGYSSGSQIIGGWLSQRFGARKVIGLGLFVQSVTSLLSPIAVRISPYLFLVIRIFQGMASGTMFPSPPVFWSRWAPRNEWARLLSTSNGGIVFGDATSFPISGLLCNYGGWEMSFYVLGAAGFLWCLVWFYYCRDSPSEMPGITEAEKNYIESSISTRVISTRKFQTPWLQIATSRAVWGCIGCHTLSNYFWYMLITQAPTFFKEVLHFDIQSNGFYSFLPYLSLFLLIMPVGFLADAMTSQWGVSVVKVRKLMNTIGMVIPAIFLTILAHISCSNPVAGVAVLTLSVSFYSFACSGHVINMADLSVTHAGVLMGISNTCAAIPGIIAPYVVAYLTPDGAQEQWRIAFYIASVTNIIGTVVFLLFASGSLQPWALPRVPNTSIVIEEQEKLQETDDLHKLHTSSDSIEPNLHKNILEYDTEC